MEIQSVRGQLPCDYGKPKTGTCLRTFTNHEEWVYGVAFFPDRKTFCSCSADGTVRHWKPQPKKIVMVLKPITLIFFIFFTIIIHTFIRFNY